MSFLSDSLKITVNRKTSFADLLTGLKAWQDLGLLTEEKLSFQTIARDRYRDSMKLTLTSEITTSNLVECLTVLQERELLTNSHLDCEVVVSSIHPAFLEGLEYWLNLGLLSDSQIKQISITHLSCRLPEVSKQEIPKVLTNESFAEPTRRPLKQRVRNKSPNRQPNRLRRMIQSLMAELSVIWLLLLGVVLVVLSSGVLAASQWENFPSFGQYGVLWLYTLGFGGASFWAIRRTNLHLTAEALQVVTLLLVPMNFLAMDSFRLWRNPLELLFMGMAALSLIILTVQIFSTNRGEVRRFSWPLGNFLSLSLLHLGWAIDWMPLGATYFGIILTTILSLIAPSSEEENFFSFSKMLVLYGVSLLLARAIFINHIEITQLGLAIGLSGWLIIWQTKHQGEWEGLLGCSLIGLGWLLSVGTIPLQALIISCLAISLLIRKLLHSWLRSDLAFIWLIGLETIWLGWRLVPVGVQINALTWLTQLTDSRNSPWSLLSVLFFPYLLLMLLVSDWLDQREKKELARFGYLLALFFATVLISLSLVNPLLRSLNFLGSTMILGAITQRNLTPGGSLFTRITTLALFTHITGLLSFILTIDWLLPNLSLGVCASILLGLMLLEIVFSLRQFSSNSLLSLLGQSAWNLGMSLSILAYALLLFNKSATSTIFNHPINSPIWGAVWLITPISLTVVATFSLNKRHSASLLSISFLVLAQFLTLFTAETRLLGLVIATLLMLVNTRNLAYLGTAIITVGFGVALFYQTLLEVFAVSESGWVLLIVLAINLLWLLRHWFSSQSARLSDLYADSTDIYGILLCCLSLVFLLYKTLNNYDLNVMSLAIIGLVAATTYRSWQAPQSPGIVWLSIITLVVVQVPLLEISPVLGFGVATGLMLFHTRSLPEVKVAAFTVGFGLGFVWFSIWDTITTLHSYAGVLLIGAILLMGLWLIRSVLLYYSQSLIYIQSINAWALFLCTLQLISLTSHSLLVFWGNIPASSLSVLASLLTLLAITYRNWQQPNNRTIYALGFSIELLVIEVIGFWGGSKIALGIVNIILGIITQILGDWLQRRSNQRTYLSSWQILPLLYGGLGTALRWGVFNSWTGLNTLGLVFILIMVGRRQDGLKPLLYLGVIGFSLSAYELLLYQVTGLSRGDQLLAMTALTTSIMYAYRLLTPLLTDFLKLTPGELKTIAHLHWGLGSLCLILAVFFPIEVNQMVGLGAGLFLARYAIFQGRNHPNSNIAEIWVYIGVLEGVAIKAYITHLIPTLGIFEKIFTPWSGIIAAIGGMVIYLLPWSNWGWINKPWRVIAMIAPIIGLGLSYGKLEEINLLGVAGFYAALAYIREQPRLTYLSLLLVNWAIASLLSKWSLATPFAYASLIGSGLLYIAWIDPYTRQVEGKALRHFLRLLGTGIICGSALLFYSDTGIFPGILAIVTIFAGLVLRIRAFLYIGTICFLADAFYQLVILITHYPIYKWVVGLIIGLSFISIAANFETRRDQLTTLFHNWINELAEWE